VAKSGFGAGKIALTVVAVVVAGVVVATVLGVMPGLSAYFGFAKQKDLGTSGDKAAFDSAMQKAGVEAQYPTTPVPTSRLKVSGKKKLSATFTDAEVSALINAYVEPFEYNVRNVQVAFHSGRRGEASAMVTYQGRDYPGYITGTVSLEGGHISGTATAAQGGGVPATGEWLQLGQDKSVDFFNLQLALPGLSIATAEMSEGEVTVTGTVPAKIEIVP
jgi:hypothetical protein